MQITIPEIQTILGKLEQIIEKLECVGCHSQQEWYYLKEACMRKGVNYNTVRTKPRYQPGGGIEDALVNGRKAWRWRTVECWLKEVDIEFSTQSKRYLEEAV